MSLIEYDLEKGTFQKTIATASSSSRRLFCLGACQRPHLDQAAHIFVPNVACSPKDRQKLSFRKPDTVPNDSKNFGPPWTTLSATSQRESGRRREWQDVVTGKRRQATFREKRRSLDIDRYLCKEEERSHANFKVFTIGDQIQLDHFWEQLRRLSSGLPKLVQAGATPGPRQPQEEFDRVINCICEIHSELCRRVGPSGSTRWLKELGNLLLYTGTPNKGFLEGVYRVWGDPAFHVFLGDHGIFPGQEDHDMIKNLAAVMSHSSSARDGETILARENEVSCGRFHEITYDAVEYSVHLFGIRPGAWRPKFVRIYEDMAGVVFIANLLDYDKRCNEDDEDTVLRHYMIMFSSVCNIKFLADRPILLILSNCWAFKSKLRTSLLSSSFPDYSGSEDPQEAVDYLVDMFRDLDHRDAGHLFTKVIDILDMSTVRDILEGFESTILQDALTELHAA